VLALLEFELRDRIVVVLVRLPFGLQLVLPTLEDARPEVDLFLQLPEVLPQAVALAQRVGNGGHRGGSFVGIVPTRVTAVSRPPVPHRPEGAASARAAGISGGEARAARATNWSPGRQAWVTGDQ